MATLVLNRDSLCVSLEGRHLVVRDHAAEGTLQRLPLVDVDRVIVAGQPAISFRVLAHLMDRRIPCCFLTHGGRWRGMMDGDYGFHAGRRILQYERMHDGDFAVQLARQLAAAKIANCRRSLQRLAADRGVSLADETEWHLLSGLLKGLAMAKSVDAVRGIEGAAANGYFKLLGRFFPKDAPFERRSRRPPRNPANALMSFVYALLENEFNAAIRAHGLDVAGGFLHKGIDRSPALALDLMEPFRPMLADRLTINLLNHRRILADRHFEVVADGCFHLTADGRGIVFRAFDEMMVRRSSSESGRITIRQLIDREVCRFIGMLEGKEPIRFHRAA